MVLGILTANLREERIKSSIGNCGWGSCPFIQRPEGESGHTVVTVQGDYEAIRIGVVGVMGMFQQLSDDPTTAVVKATFDMYADLSREPPRLECSHGR